MCSGCTILCADAAVVTCEWVCEQAVAVQDCVPRKQGRRKALAGMPLHSWFLTSSQHRMHCAVFIRLDSVLVGDDHNREANPHRLSSRHRGLPRHLMFVSTPECTRKHLRHSPTLMGTTHAQKERKLVRDGKEMVFQFHETLGQEAFVCPDAHTHQNLTERTVTHSLHRDHSQAATFAMLQRLSTCTTRQTPRASRI